jgi:hypothetical protein
MSENVDQEQLQQEEQLFPWLDSNFMADLNFFDEQRNADYLDAMSDLASEQEEAMRESNQSDWDGVEEISIEERNACDHYNERYVR